MSKTPVGSMNQGKKILRIAEFSGMEQNDLLIAELICEMIQGDFSAGKSFPSPWLHRMGIIKTDNPRIVPIMQRQ